MDNLEYLLGQINKSIENSNEKIDVMSERLEKHIDSHKADNKYVITTFIAVIGLGLALAKLWI